MKNKFLNAIFKRSARTENGAISNASTSSALLDYFSKAGTYRKRTLEEVFADMSAIWNEHPTDALKLIFYNRMISRSIKGFETTEKMQMGQGNRDEFRKSIIWLARYKPEILNMNLWMIPMVGCWKDLWHMELMDELDEVMTFELISKGINCEYNKDLLAKYLPRIRSKSNVYNERHAKLNAFAFGLIKYLKWTPVQYRKFKSSGKAHDFQKKMSNGLFSEIDFKAIPGKALFQIVHNKGLDKQTTLERHGLDAAYLDWIQKQPVAKFTGYVYELMDAVKPTMSLIQKHTVDRQFAGLIEKAKEVGKISENVWCALDTSGSMTARVADTTAFDICLSLGVYFSTLNEGAFKDHVIMFDRVSRVKALSGAFSDKIIQLRSATTAWGNTNFQSVIDEIVRIRMESPEIPISEFPTTLLVVSDMQFDSAGRRQRTNYETAMKKLRRVGLPNIRIVWWWVTDRGTDFPSTLEDEGTILIGGFDGAILSLLLNEEDNGIEKDNTRRKAGPYEAMQKALSQEILELIHV